MQAELESAAEPQNRRAQAVALRRQGFSHTQIARRLGVHKSVVGRWVAEVPFDGHSEESRAESLAAFRDPHLYNQALQLRQAGWSYNMISDKLGVSKSTLSGWLRNVQLPEERPEVRDRILAGHRKAVQVNKVRHQRKVANIEEQAVRELRDRFSNGLTENELFLVGLALYWAEGGKTNAQVYMANSDPAVIRTFVLWVTRCFDIKMEQLRAHINIYPDVDVNEAETYWAEVIGIPRSQFYRAQIDTRSDKSVDKQGKLRYGTAYIVVRGKGVSGLHRKIMTWITDFGQHLEKYARE